MTAPTFSSAKGPASRRSPSGAGTVSESIVTTSSPQPVRTAALGIPLAAVTVQQRDRPAGAALVAPVDLEYGVAVA